MDPDPDPGGPKTCGSGGSGSGSATQHVSVYQCSGSVDISQRIQIQIMDPVLNPTWSFCCVCLLSLVITPVNPVPDPIILPYYFIKDFFAVS
jgi:hypothetical protein